MLKKSEKFKYLAFFLIFPACCTTLVLDFYECTKIVHFINSLQTQTTDFQAFTILAQLLLTPLELRTL